MKALLRCIPALAGLTLLASCHGIGNGNTVKTLKIVYAPVSGEQGALLTAANSAGTANPVSVDTLRMYDCFCSTVVIYGYFDDGTIGDFTSRATLISSDPSIVQVAKFDTTQPCAFTQNDPSVWSLVPKSVGSATLTAEFVGLKATLQVNVVDTASELQPTLKLVPADAASGNTGHVAVGTTIRWLLQGTLDGTLRTFNTNVASNWSLTSSGDTDCVVPRTDNSAIPNSCRAIVSDAALNGGLISGLVPTGTTDGVVQAVLNACPAGAAVRTTTAPFKVGDFVQPLAIAEEDAFYPATPGSDQTLAVNSNELLKVTGTLDYRDNSTPSDTQIISSSTTLTYSNACNLRSYKAGGDPSSTLTDCQEQATPSCAGTVPACSTAMTACTSGMTACRTDTSPIVPTLFNGIVANADSAGAFTNFSAQFPPGALGTQTTLSAGIGASDTTLTVAALTGFPGTVPWYGVINKDSLNGGTREDVRVVAVSGTTLTVVRGQGGTTATTHNASDTFDERSYSSGSVPVKSKSGTLTTLAIFDPASTTDISGSTLTDSTSPAFLKPLGQLQLQAIGTYDDGAGNTRQQSVTHLTAANSGPAVTWSSSDRGVAFVVSTSGLVTSSSVCGGPAVIRARATSSTNTIDSAFATTVTSTFTDANVNGNDDANDAQCDGTTNDKLCRQVSLCIPTQNPLPLGVSCTKTTTYDSGTQKCVVQ